MRDDWIPSQSVEKTYALGASSLSLLPPPKRPPPRGTPKTRGDCVNELLAKTELIKRSHTDAIMVPEKCEPRWITRTRGGRERATVIRRVCPVLRSRLRRPIKIFDDDPSLRAWRCPELVLKQIPPCFIVHTVACILKKQWGEKQPERSTRNESSNTDITRRIPRAGSTLRLGLCQLQVQQGCLCEAPLFFVRG